MVGVTDLTNHPDLFKSEENSHHLRVYGKEPSNSRKQNYKFLPLLSTPIIVRGPVSHKTELHQSPLPLRRSCMEQGASIGWWVVSRKPAKNTHCAGRSNTVKRATNFMFECKTSLLTVELADDTFCANAQRALEGCLWVTVSPLKQ